jgi:hypothetical protein
VDPTIAAAWITGGVGALGIVGAVVTNIVGSRSTKRATEATIAAGVATTAATLAAARDDRLWEKRCAAYEETLATLMNHRKQRPLGMSPADDAEKMRSIDSDSPEWAQELGRLYAYASGAVLAAWDSAQDAHTRVLLLHSQLNELKQQSPGHPRASSEREALRDISQKLNAAWEVVGATEQALIKVIRDELRSKP